MHSRNRYHHQNVLPEEDVLEDALNTTLISPRSKQLQQQQSDEISASSWKWFDFKHANGTVEAFNEYSRSVFSRRNHHNQTTGNLLQVHWLNIYNSTVLRKDGHVAFGDCLHYLQPGPYSNWVHLFYSGLLDLARMQHVIWSSYNYITSMKVEE